MVAFKDLDPNPCSKTAIMEDHVPYICPHNPHSSDFLGNRQASARAWKHWGFPKFGGTFLGIPIIRIVEYSVLVTFGKHPYLSSTQHPTNLVSELKVERETASRPEALQADA